MPSRKVVVFFIIGLVAGISGTWILGLTVPFSPADQGHVAETSTPPTTSKPTDTVTDTPKTRTSEYSVQNTPDDINKSIELQVRSMNFERPDEPLFFYNSHDAVVFDGGKYLLVHHRQTNRILFKSKHGTAETNPKRLKPVATQYLSDHRNGSIDTAIRVKNRYIAYQDGKILTTTDLVTGNWTHRNTVDFLADAGAYYDSETGLVHVYYEVGSRNNHSGSRIGHATSPNGVTNWSIYPPVYTASGGYSVGDFDVVRTDKGYVMFGDYTQNHPNYSVSVWVNTNLYSNFTRAGNALEPRDGRTPYYWDDQGVQDPAVVRESGEYIIYAHGHKHGALERRLHAYRGEIELVLNRTGG